MNEDPGLAQAVVNAYSAASMNSARTLQSAARILGPSDLGGCRSYLAHVLKESPRDERQKPPWAAFIGTWVGEGLEQAYVASRPRSRSQVAIKATLPSGRTTQGTADIIDPDLDGVVDFKSRDGIESLVNGQPPFKNLVQIMCYLLGAIQMGLLSKDATWNLAYVDRSGEEPTPVVISGTLDMDVIREMEERIAEAEYAALFGEDAPRDEPYSFCEQYCLAGETEVVTRKGIVPIRSLAGGEAELLTPAPHGDGFSVQSTWGMHKVLSFGEQPLRTITLRRGRAKKIVRATPEHQWFVRHGRGQRLVETQGLVPGDVLRDISRGTGPRGIVPPAVAQGFVHGDGDTRAVRIYDSGSDKIEMLRFFRNHSTTRIEGERSGTEVRGIPSLWKRGPDMSESPSFLLSWLAGYFAADGSMSIRGQATISSVNLESIQAVRDVCAVVGVGYGPVRSGTRMTNFSGGKESVLYSVSIRTSDLPEWFWLRTSQASRVKPGRDTHRRWSVVSVEDRGDVEEVFCAVVPGVEAFALSDGLLTHNCEYFTACRGDWQPPGLITEPEVVSAADRYLEGAELEKRGKRLKSEAKATLKGSEGSTGTAIVRWLTVNGGRVEAFERKPSERVDVRRVK